MQSAEFPAKLKDEELLKLLQTDGLRESTGPFKNNITLFLHHFQIEPGNEPVKTKALYKLYKLWCEDTLKYTNFANLLYLFLPREKSFCTINKIPVEILDLIASELKAREPKTKIKTLTSKKRLDAFFLHHKIKDGKFFVENYVLYHLYDAYCHDNKYKALSEKEFTKVLSLYFDHKRGPKGFLLVAVHEDLLQTLPLDIIKDLRNARTKGLFHGKKKNKTS